MGNEAKAYTRYTLATGGASTAPPPNQPRGGGRLAELRSAFLASLNQYTDTIKYSERRRSQHNIY